MRFGSLCFRLLCVFAGLLTVFELLIRLKMIQGVQFVYLFHLLSINRSIAFEWFFFFVFCCKPIFCFGWFLLLLRHFVVISSLSADRNTLHYFRFGWVRNDGVAVCVANVNQPPCTNVRMNNVIFVLVYRTNNHNSGWYRGTKKKRRPKKYLLLITEKLIGTYLFDNGAATSNSFGTGKNVGH